MKIAVWHNLLSGGGKRALHYHVAGLIKRGHEITVFCPDTVDQSYLPLSSMAEEKIFPLRERIKRLRKYSLQKCHSYELTIERLKLMIGHCIECSAIINQGDFD